MQSRPPLRETLTRAIAVACVMFCAAAGGAFAQFYPPPKEQTAPPPDDRLRMPDQPAQTFNFLQGCWKTDPFQHAPTKPVGTSTYCFDEKGKGTLVYESPSYTCRLPATAKYEGNKLLFVDSDGTCSDGVSWTADHLDCDRGSDSIASCSGSAGSDRWTVTLHRLPGRP